jgi:hypothetical protein
VAKEIEFDDLEKIEDKKMDSIISDIKKDYEYSRGNFY